MTIHGETESVSTPYPDHVRIIGPPTAAQGDVLRAFRDQVAQRVPTARVGEALATATEVISHEWAWAQEYRLDPVGTVAQVALETGWLGFPGRIDSRWRNPCGLKVRDPGVVSTYLTGEDQPLAHAQFPSWAIGCLAHCQHVAAYAGTLEWSDLPVVDPRVSYVTPPAAESWEELGGRWAPSVTYGQQVEAVARTLVGAAAA